MKLKFPIKREKPENGAAPENAEETVTAAPENTEAIAAPGESAAEDITAPEESAAENNALPEKTEPAKAPASRLEQLEQEIKRMDYNSRFHRLIRSTFYTLVVVAAFAVLVAVLFMPVIRIYGGSMTPTLTAGEIVVSVKTNHVKPGEIVAVYHGNKLLIKRCIATSGQWVDIDKDGTVYVYDVEKGAPLSEPYVTEKAFGETNIELPYQVPENSIFVMGDHRATSVDSRSSEVGCIDMENVVGRIIFKAWPIKQFGRIK